VLITVPELAKYWGVSPKGIIHVGAHEAEESTQYKNAKWGNVIWVEAQPDKAELLRNRFLKTEDKVIEAAVWSTSGVPLELHIMSSSASTSLLNLGTHLTAHPDISLSHSINIETQVLADLIPDNSNADYLCLDIQGAELEAIKGFGSGLERIRWIYTEVNRDELYENCCLVDDLDAYLEDRGFTRAATRWTEFGWGDALYERIQTVEPRNLLKRLLWKFLNAMYYLNRKTRVIIKTLIHS
jgi:FkbM family methyltransferase